MLKSILIPIDGTDLSYKPMATAVALAKLGQGKLIVLSVAEPRQFHSTESNALEDGRTAEAMNVTIAKENIRKALESVKEADVRWESVISVSEVPCDAILETAQRFECDLILMATRGQMGVVSSLFNESTTQEVLRKTAIPVLVFPNN